MLVTPVFPSSPTKVGMYESFYLRAVSPDEPIGAWIRCTVHKRPGKPPQGSVWCTVFDATSSDLAQRAPFMHKLTSDDLSVPDGGWISIADTSLSPGACVGSCGPASWSLRFEAQEPELRHLPHSVLYKAPLPRTKLTSPAPAARFEGEIELPGRKIDLSGWRGMVGHNWGAEHAERWIWLHGICFDRAPSAWIDLAVGRIAIAGHMTPWVANGAAGFEGSRLRLGGLGARGLRVAERPQRCSLHVPAGRKASIEAHVEAPEGASAGWRYADPDGGEHDVVNCSVSALTLVLRRKGLPSQTLRTAHGCAYELGMREHDHRVPIAPFADG